MDARPFECCNGLDLEATIPGAAGDHDGARPDPFAVRETEHEPRAIAVVVALETGHFVRYRHLGSELLCLIEGAGHQRHPADAGREPEIVLDPCRRPRLASERAAIEHDDGQAFRCAVDGCREACRSGTDDREVVRPRRIDRADEAEAACELGLARVLEDAAVRAEHDRQLRRIDVEPLDEGSRARVGAGIELLVRMAVPREESSQPQHVAGSRATDDHRSAHAALQQAHAP